MSEQYTVYQEKAYKEIKVAFELLEATYSLSQDPKVLVNALHHLKDAQDACMNFIMYLEGKPKSIELFLQLAKDNHHLSAEELQVIEDVHRLCREQQESGVEFRRKESYVVCNDSYDLSTITYELVHTHLIQTIALIKKIVR